MADLCLKKGPLARWSAARKGLFVDWSSLFEGTDVVGLSTGESGGGRGNLQIIRLNSVDDVGDIAVFDY
jgi:hypothetical protein